MNRRGHLSSKVPNVKLRPARGGSTLKRKEPSPLNDEDEEILRDAWQGAEDEDTSSTGLRSSRRPWESVVITFTGVDNKASLTEKARQLGASIESALTVNVSHVVASGFGSPKYLYAVEHRIPVMRPDWIEETHAAYIAGDEINVEDSMADMRLLPFTGLNIAMSGIEPIERRREIIHYITMNGGIYSKDLDRDCTHLISAKMTTERNQSAKVKWAMGEINAIAADRRRGKKVEGTEMWIVFEEWIWDCVGYGGRWKEDMYDARKVRRTPRCLAEDVLNGLVKRPATPPPAVQEHKVDNAVQKRRKKEAYDQVIKELVSAAPQAKTVEKKTSSASPAPEGTVGGRRKTGQEVEERKSLLHASRGGSFAAPVPGSSTGAGTLAAAQASKAEKAKNDMAAAPQTVEEEEEEDKEYPQIYKDLAIVPYISADMRPEHLETALRKHGARVVSADDWAAGVKADYIVVRLYSRRRPDFSNVPVANRPTLVTECWVEGCCYERRLIPPTEQIVFQPLKIDLPVPRSEKIIVHVTGFTVELGVYMKRLCKALGFAWSIKLHKQTTHLIAAQPRGQKYDKALEWGVEVVKDTWIYRVAQTGMLETLAGHRHQPTAVESADKEEGADPNAMDIDQHPLLPTEAEIVVAQTSSVAAPTTAPATAAASSQSRRDIEKARLEEEGQKENIDTSMRRSASLSGTGLEGERAKSQPHSQSQKPTRIRDAKTPTSEAPALANVLSPPRNASQRRLNGASVKHEETQTVAKEEPQSLPLRDAGPVKSSDSIPSSGIKPSVAALQKMGLDSPARGIGRTVSAPDESPSLSRKREREARGDKVSEVSRSASVSAVPNTATGFTGTGSSSSGLAASNKASEVSDIMRLLDGPEESMSAGIHDGMTKDSPAGLTKSTSSTVNNAVNKMIRRGRPSTRLRTSTTSGMISTPRHSAHAGDVSGDTTMDTTIMFTPSPTGSRTSRGTGHGREMSGTPGLGEDVDMDRGAEYAGAGARAGGMLSMGFGAGLDARGTGSHMDPAEESVRVDYVDPAAEKEKRRMFEQFKRNEKERAKKARVGNL